MFLDPAPANRLYGVGDKYVEGNYARLIWIGTESGSFTSGAGNNEMAVTVPDNEYFPDPDEFTQYWAQFGAVGNKYFRTVDSLFPVGVWEPLLGRGGSGGKMTHGLVGQRVPGEPVPSKNSRIIGINNATLFHRTTTSGAGDGELSYVTSGAIVSGIDITSRAGEARILLLNETGSSVTVIEAAITGTPILLFTGDEGYIHDTFIDRADIMKNGERILSFGGGDVINGAQYGQLDRLADYLWKDRSVRKHIYVCASQGALHDIGPNEWMWIDVGAVGTAEDIAGTMGATGVTISAYADSIGKTEITYREVTEAWKHDSNAFTRFFARGVPVRSAAPGGEITIGAQFETTDTDYRVQASETSAEDYFNSAIDLISGSFGGGTLRVKEGTYKIDGAIEGKSNVKIVLDPGAIIEKNCNDYAIKAVGGAGTEITNFTIEGRGKITRNAADTNANHLIYCDYVDGLTIQGVIVEDAYDAGIYIKRCDGGVISQNEIDTFESYGIVAHTCTKIRILGNHVHDGKQFGIYAYAGSENVIKNNNIKSLTESTNHLYGIAITSTNSVCEGNILDTLTSTAAASPVTAIAAQGDNVQIIANNIRNITIANTSGSGTIIIATTQNNIVISGNTIETVTHSGTQDFTGIGCSAGGAVTIGNNVLQNFNKTGAGGNVRAIAIQVAHCLAQGNIIKDFDIDNAGNSDDLSGIIAYGAASGVIINSNEISDLTITSGTGTTYGIEGNDDRIAVHGNVVEDIDDYGIYQTGDNALLSANIAEGCDTGIEIHTTADRTVVTGNRSTNNTTDNFDDNGTNTTDVGNDWT